jgi:hypothetical protein
MIESYEDIAACVTYMGNVERRSFRLDSYDGNKTNDDKKNTSASRTFLLLHSTSEGEANRASKKREKQKGKGY